MTKHITTLLLIWIVSCACIAQEQLPISSDVIESPPLKKSRINRTASQYYGLLTYSPLDLIIPSKYGATIGYIENPDSLWELEYVRGSLSTALFFSDLGKMTDTRISALRRVFFETNSFYMSYGLSYMDFSTQLGSEYIASITNGSIPEVSLLKMRNIGAQLSIGNQWAVYKNVIIGVDWVGLYQPIIQLEKHNAFVDATSDPALRDNVEEMIDALSWIPRLTFVKFQIGASF